MLRKQKLVNTWILSSSDTQTQGDHRIKWQGMCGRQVEERVTHLAIYGKMYIFKKKFLKGAWIHLSVSELFVQKIVPVLQNA